ncbi:PAS domain-containing protein, partial [Roseovarius salis]|uniref:PAS domain-containing protein n=1 Tax=Roseovarius salis TaxID=3376063 RepID=UPI0037C5E32D
MKDRFQPHNAPRGSRGVTPLHQDESKPAAGRTDALLHYWQSLCGRGTLPRRADVEPRAIGALLPDTFLLERIAPGLARFRVAGTHLSELMGMDVRGMPVSCLIAPSDRDDLAESLAALFDRPACLRLDLRSAAGVSRPALTGRMLLLPLLGRTGAVDHALGCLVTSGPPGRPPRRFCVTDQRTQTAAPRPSRAA